MRVRFVMAGALVVATSAAADDHRRAFDVSGEIGVVSDYRWRGASLTGDDPAIQAGLAIAQPGGLYAGIWGAAPTRNAGDVEIDLSVGDRFKLAGGAVDVSVVHYLYPDADGHDYTNFAMLYEHPMGKWIGRGRLEYAPQQRNLHEKSLYAALEAQRPIGETGVVLTGGVGWEEGAFTRDGQKWDYALGVRYRVRRVSFAVLYTDTDEGARAGEEDIYGPNTTFSVKAEF